MRNWEILWQQKDSGTHGTTTVRASYLEAALKNFYKTFNKASIEILSIDGGDK